jgi:transcriptional regulator with XRE-family HTH domain
MPIIPGLGDRLREARRKSGLSLEEASRRAGTNRRSLYSYEKGLVDPRVGDLAEIAAALGTSLIWLITGDERTSEIDQEIVRTAIRQHLMSLDKEDLLEMFLAVKSNRADPSAE